MLPSNHHRENCEVAKPHCTHGHCCWEAFFALGSLLLGWTLGKDSTGVFPRVWIQPNVVYEILHIRHSIASSPVCSILTQPSLVIYCLSFWGKRIEIASQQTINRFLCLQIAGELLCRFDSSVWWGLQTVIFFLAENSISGGIEWKEHFLL